MILWQQCVGNLVYCLFMGILFGGFVYWYFAIVRYRKIGLGLVCVHSYCLLCVFPFLHHKNRQFSNDSAVICASSVTVKNSPDSTARNILYCMRVQR